MRKGNVKYGEKRLVVIGNNTSLVRVNVRGAEIIY